MSRLTLPSPTPSGPSAHGRLLERLDEEIDIDATAPSKPAGIARRASPGVPWRR